MELTVRRMIGIAVAAFLLLVVARPPRPSGPSYYARALQSLAARERVQQEQTATLDTLRVIEYTIWSSHVRDSVQRVLASLPAERRDAIFVDPLIPASLRRHLTEVYTSSRTRMGPQRMALPMFVLLDTTQSYRLGTTLWIESEPGSFPFCATVLRARVSRDARSDVRTLSRDLVRLVPANFPQPAHFGLCGFEGAFGAPSTATRRWLAAREFLPVGGGYDVRRPSRPVRYLSDLVFPRYGLQDNGARALDVRACATGRTDKCLGAVAPVAERPQGGPNQVWSDWRWYSWEWRGAPDLMNAIATSVGSESFGNLWRGDEAPDVAYQRVTGVPLDTLARRTLLGGTEPMRAGTTVRPSDFVPVLLMTLVLVALATLPHPRRRRN